MLQQLIKESDLETVMKSPALTWLFKHSNTCSVSSAAFDEVHNFLSAHPEQNVRDHIESRALFGLGPIVTIPAL